MRQRVITGFIFTVLVLSFFVPALWWPVTGVAMAVIIGVVACVEMYKAIRNGGYHPSRLLLIIGMCLATLIVICGLIFKLNVESIMALYLIVVCMYCVSCGINLPLVRPEDDKAFLNGMFTGGMIFYISFPLFCFVSALLFVPNGWYYMVIGLFAPWGTDTFAYAVGRRFGKHKLTSVSPKKSIEGSIGGTIGSVVVALIFTYIIKNNIDIDLSYMLVGITTCILSIFSQIGDLAASSIKREMDVKDYGNLLPGHGGMLDRIDSLIFIAPFAYFLFILL